MQVRAWLVRMLALMVAIGGLSIGLTAPAHAAVVTGEVTDAATTDGIADAYVEAYSDDDFAEATTGADGSYSMDLSPGFYELYASADGYESGWTEVEVTESTTTLPVIELEPLPEPVSVTGTVVDAATDAGIVDAYVEADGPDFVEATTGAGGAYSLELPPGYYDLYASADGYESGWAEVEVTESTTTLPVIELEPQLPGIEVSVWNNTFSGPAANVDVSLTPQGGGSPTVLTTDADGEAVFTDLADGQYVVQVVPGNGWTSADEPVVVDYTGGFDSVSLSVDANLGCEPAAANPDLTNMGFENGLDSWTLGFRTESIEAVGADAFTSPWEGSSMARLGHSQPSSGEDQPEGPNIMCQDFEVTDAQETFAFNVFTYDYTGFDEFKFDVVVTDPDSGETLAAYEQGAWGEGTALKTSGWRGVQLDLSDHVGDTVRLSFRAGGTSDSLYAFWVYLDSAVNLPPTIDLATTDVETETGSVTTDPTTGQVTVSMPFGDKSDLSMQLPGECEDPEATPTSVSVILNGAVYDGVLGDNGLWQVTIPADSIDSGPLSVQVVCEGETTLVAPIGQIVLYDPSGIISDAESGDPVVGAEVHLFKVPGWTPQGETGPYPENSCQTNLSKEEGAPWDQPAPTELGELVNAASPEISPNVNPFITNNIGYYGWDVAEGCWYVEVSKNGYATLTSPVVGVPTEVTDLDLELEPTGLVNTDEPTISGSPKVGSTLTADPGTWNIAGAAFAYQWQRNGTPIAGATAATYQVAAADVDEPLTVKVTASKSGYDDGTATSDPVTGALGDAPEATTMPSISGTPSVGRTLTADPGVWDLAGTAFAYQWQRNGTPIAGATASTYQVAVGDVLAALSVVVTATKAGYSDGSATSTPVTVAKMAPKVKLKLPEEVSSDERAVAKVVVKLPEGAVATGKVVIKAGKKTVGSGKLKSGKAKIKLDELEPGKYKLKAKYAGSPTVDKGVSKKVALKVVK